MSLIGDGIGHVAFAGVGVRYLLGVSPVLIALVFYTGIAAGVVIVSATGALNVNRIRLV